MNSNLPAIVTRFGAPGKMDTAPFGTACRVSSAPEAFDIYLQISHDEEEPNWTFIGTYDSQLSADDLHTEINRILLSKQLS